MVPSPKIKCIGRQVDAVSHLELLPLKAGQSKQSLGVAIFIQRFKYLRYFLFSLFSSPNTADAEPEGTNSHQQDDENTVGEALRVLGSDAYLNLQSSDGVVLGGVSKRANSRSYQNW